MKKPTDRFSLFGNKENESDKIKRDTFPAEIAPYYVRPKEANPLIDKEFQTIASATEDLYWQTGAPNYSFQSEGLVISASHIIKKKIKEQSPVKVLDVGAGNFMFERQNKKRFGDRVVIYGLAANDMYRKASLRQADEYHQFKNAEYLAEIYEKNQFDLIVSRQTYKHFVDPLGAITEAYQTLAVNGTLCIDSFKVPGCEDYLESLIPFLQEQGYLVIGRNENNQINSFIIQKTADKPELKFPFEFLKVENDALHYQTTQQFSEYHKNNAYPREQQLFDEGKDLLFNSIQDDIPYDWLRECDSLLDLLSSPEYQSLADNKLQYLYILVFVATHYDYAQFDSILSDCRAENERFSFDLLRQLYTFTIKRLDSGFTTLMTHPDFKRYQRAPYDEGENIEKGREQQLRLLVLAGLDDIQRLAKAKQNQHMCDRMNLPFKARNDIDLIDFCVMLDFPNLPPKEYNLDSLLQDIEQYSDSELRVRRAQVSRLIADYVNTRETLADLEALLTVLKDDSQFGFLREDKMMFDGFGPTVTWKTITYEIKNRAWEIVNETSELTSEKYEQATTIFNEQKGVFEFQTKSFAERFQSLIVDVQIDDKDDREFSKGL